MILALRYRVEDESRADASQVSEGCLLYTAVHRLLGASVVFWRQRGLPAVRGLHVSDSSQLVPAEKALVCREKTGEREKYTEFL